MNIRLGELIKILENEPKNMKVPLGFGSPHSYRGYYEQLAFEPLRNVKVSVMLKAAKSALGETYDGYKGGEYTMNEDSYVWLANYGHEGDELSKTLLDFMLGKYQL